MIKCIVNIEYFWIFWEGGWYLWPLRFGHERFHQPVTACCNPYHVTPPTTPPTYKNMQSDTSVILTVYKQWLSQLLHFQLYTVKSYLYLKHERAHLITSLPLLFICLIAGPYNMTLAKYSSLTLECFPARLSHFIDSSFSKNTRKESLVPRQFLNQDYVYLLNWNRISYTSVKDSRYCNKALVSLLQ